MTRAVIIILILFLFLSINTYSQVVINEIQAAPANGQPEWIELFNYGSVQIHLNSPSISDAVKPKQLPAFALNAKQYAVVTSDTIQLLARRKIPSNTLLIQSALPILNNTTDVVVLKDNSNLIDSVYYDMAWGYYGISLERIDYLVPAVNKSNLVPSESEDSATCGYRNSRAIRENDISLDSINYQQNTKTLLVKIRNNGRNDLSQTHFTLMIDINKDGIYQNSESFYEDDISLIMTKSTYSIEIPVNSINGLGETFGFIKFKAFVYNKSDEIQTNDSLQKEVFIPYPFGSVLINEFLTDNKNCKCEFIELFNTRNENIPLNKWFIRDGSPAQKANPFQIISDSFAIAANGYAVVALDSNCMNIFPELSIAWNSVIYNVPVNLNTDGDEIVLIDPNLNIEDSLLYSSDWKTYTGEINNCLSLEKINPYLISSIKNNWINSSANSGATPVKENSIVYPFDSTGAIKTEPNPFSSFSSGKDQMCSISYNLKLNDSKISAKIYDMNGIKTRTIVDNNVLPSKGIIFWDGKNDSGFHVQIGPYVLIFEAEDIVNHNVFQQKILVVVGK